MQDDHCTARSRHTKLPCRNRAMKGQRVCRMHGGATGQARRAAAVRTLLADALERGDRRAPEVILMDTLHAADVLFRDIKFVLGKHDELSPTQLDDFVTAFERANRIAKVVMDAKVMDRLARQAKIEGETIGLILNEAIAEADLDEDTAFRLRRALRNALLRQDQRERENDDSQPAITARAEVGPAHRQRYPRS